MDLFSQSQITENSIRPLAEEMRPKTLEGFVGQSKAAGLSTPLMKNILFQKSVPNIILWGPPGTGKTTFAHLLATKVEAEFIVVNAIDAGAKKLREIGQAARDRKLHLQRSTILFVDEIHRLNKAQQDVLLPFAERGDFSLIGATTENPSYELNSALLSRCRLLIFEKHQTQDLLVILEACCKKKCVVLTKVLSLKAIELLLVQADGDARRLLNIFEQVLQSYSTEGSSNNWPLTDLDFKKVSAGSPIYYDKKGDEHYNCVSAFIKSIRGSDPDAAIYYLARMLEGGENPVFIARRLVIAASEDIGNADPRALTMAVSGLQAVELVGMPEARINLAQVTTYLASAPKSNRSYLALDKAIDKVRSTGQLPVPKPLRSSQTKLMRQLGYGVDYKYSHSGEKGYVEQQFLPEEIKGEKFYEPVERGFEKNIREYLAWMKS